MACLVGWASRLPVGTVHWVHTLKALQLRSYAGARQEAHDQLEVSIIDQNSQLAVALEEYHELRTNHANIALVQDRLTRTVRALPSLATNPPWQPPMRTLPGCKTGWLAQYSTVLVFGDRVLLEDALGIHGATGTMDSAFTL
jgi:hypothetical protein